MYRTRKMIFLPKILLLVCMCFASYVDARGVYQTNEDFLNEVFNGEKPQSQVVWMKGDIRQQVTEILGHAYKGLRIRYWKEAERSVWILEEIGKEQPITFGIVVNQQKIEQVKVLAFRESRGWEIKYPAFSEQFAQAELEGMKLNKDIDGISGATLSVRAMTSVVTLALYLDSVTSQQS